MKKYKDGWKVYRKNKCLMHGVATVKQMAIIANGGYKITLDGEDVTQRLLQAFSKHTNR